MSHFLVLYTDHDLLRTKKTSTLEEAQNFVSDIDDGDFTCCPKIKIRGIYKKVE